MNTFDVRLSRARLFRDFLVRVELINIKGCLLRDALETIRERELRLPNAEIFEAFDHQFGKENTVAKLDKVFILDAPPTPQGGLIGMITRDSKPTVAEFQPESTLADVWLAGWKPIGGEIFCGIDCGIFLWQGIVFH